MATGHPKIIVFIRNALGAFFTALGNFSFSLFLNVTKNKKLEAYSLCFTSFQCFLSAFLWKLDNFDLFCVFFYVYYFILEF